MKYQLIKIPEYNIIISKEKEQVVLNKWYYESDNHVPIYQFTKDTLPNEYYLNEVIAGYSNLPSIDYSMLSKEDCKKIGWIDVEKYADKVIPNLQYSKWVKQGFIGGFEISQSLNEKKFTLEDMEAAICFGKTLERLKITQTFSDKEEFKGFIMSLSQPKIFDIEIETEWRYGDMSVTGYTPKINNNSIKITKI